MDRRTLVYAPRAQRDLRELPKQDASLVVKDLELLQSPPWPPGKVKKLHGHAFWEIKTGDFRTLFWPQGRDVVVLRVFNRRDLEKAVDRINIHALLQWLRERGPHRTDD